MAQFVFVHIGTQTGLEDYVRKSLEKVLEAHGIEPKSEEILVVHEEDDVYSVLLESERAMAYANFVGTKEGGFLVLRDVSMNGSWQHDFGTMDLFRGVDANGNPHLVFQ
jgi:hypothetical protein